MVKDEMTEEEIENGLIDSKTIELDNKFKEASTGATRLEVIWESMSYNFKKIRTRQHINTSAIQKMAMEQYLMDKKIQEISVKQSAFKPKVEEHMKQGEKQKIKTEATWGLITKVLGGTGTLIVMILAILQLFTILGGF